MAPLTDLNKRCFPPKDVGYNLEMQLKQVKPQANEKEPGLMKEHVKGCLSCGSASFTKGDT